MADHLTAQFLGAPLDVDQLLRDLPVRGLDVSACMLALQELKQRRGQAEGDLRFMQHQIEEIGHLKRRLEKLRAALNPGFDVWAAQAARDADTATMQRAISKERARLAKTRREAAAARELIAPGAGVIDRG